MWGLCRTCMRTARQWWVVYGWSDRWVYIRDQHWARSCLWWGQVNRWGQPEITVDCDVCSRHWSVVRVASRWRYALERGGMKARGSKTEHMCVNEKEAGITANMRRVKMWRPLNKAAERRRQPPGCCFLRIKGCLHIFQSNYFSWLIFLLHF